MRRTPALDAVLDKFHKHYIQSANQYFAVLTQSCDLVRRDGPCSARYISLAAVRPVNTAIEREIEQYYSHPVERRLKFADDAGRSRAVNFVERLLNNNEDEYFFLYREPELGFDSDQCIFLPLSVPLKSEFHYDTLLEAKILQLGDDFQHKLGYLVGKMYGRVGTADWVPTRDESQDVFRARAEAYVLAISRDKQIVWLPRDQYRPVTKVLRTLPDDEATDERLKTEIENVRGRKEATVAQTLELVAEACRGAGIDEPTIGRVRSRLATLNTFRGLIR